MSDEERYNEAIARLEAEIVAKDAAYEKLKLHLETCQDAYDRDIEFKPGMLHWDLLQATQESLREHMDIIKKLHDQYDRDAEFKLLHLNIIKKQEADLALWDGREKVWCAMIDASDAKIEELKEALYDLDATTVGDEFHKRKIGEKDSQIEQLKEGYKRNKYGFIRENAALKEELAKAKDDIRQMVEKAADNHLEGYREMGRQLAEKDAEIDSLKEKLQDPPGESQEPTATEEEQDLPENYRPPYG